TRLGNGLSERRSLRREQLYCRGRCGISKRVCTLWLRQQFADWNFVLWPAMERTDPHQDCICVRASHAIPPAAEVFTHPPSGIPLLVRRGIPSEPFTLLPNPHHQAFQWRERRRVRPTS